ncbi:hypothetical protein Ahy_B02g059933 [Arachis hypogaea]|uniref:DUF223 domain-containing protein n=1 Tax=Arachis hypogaea TaxID=3818 RepID=A0A445AHL2_ARAHY|nr:hypothetical protein Ahy_B02g059933 [Arachis hypogaea]
MAKGSPPESTARHARSKTGCGGHQMRRSSSSLPLEPMNVAEMAMLNVSNSATHGFNRVVDINPSKLEWSVVVGIYRDDPQDEQPVGLLMFFLNFSYFIFVWLAFVHRVIESIELIVIFRSVIREHEIYSMKNFIVQGYGKSVRSTPHKNKLSFYMKTSYEEIESTASIVAQNHLIDCIGHVVAKENARDLVTKTRQHTKRMVVYLEDLEGHKMKCTLFGNFVDEMVTFLHRPDCEPLVMVAQFFKPYVYLNDVNIQSSFDPS